MGAGARVHGLVARLLVTVVIVALVACGATTAPGDGSATVATVIDGDTIDVDIGGRTERVRLIGIDTPETKVPDRPVECFGPEASAYTAALLPPGAPIRIERDIVGRDDYGRLLGYVHLVDGADERFVNLEIVRSGHATPLSIGPNTAHAAEFADAARAAEAADIGLWAVCSS